MNFIDTHTHLYLKEFAEDRALVISNAKSRGVTTMLIPAIDKEHFESMINLCTEFKDSCFPMIGVHPTSIDKNWKEEFLFVEEKIKENIYYAVGEIGIDLYWDKTFYAQQIEALEAQIDLSNQYHLPIVLHVRNAFPQIFDILKNFNLKNSGVFHCFSGNSTHARMALDLGFLIGIGGVVTYKNSGLDKVCQYVGVEYILLETDAPYLSPIPHRGKRNEPAYIPFIAEKIASLLNISIEKVAETTTQNAKKLFNLKF